MPFPRSPRKPATAGQAFYTLFVVMLMGLVCGPLFFFIGIHAERRDRVSLEWPKTTGKMLQCDKTYHSGGIHSSGSYSFAVSYSYSVNNQRYFGNQIALWSPDLRGGSADFAATHPVAASVDVFYDPKNPGNAVLIPGANETLNRLFMVNGSIAFAFAVLLAFRMPSKYAAYKAQIQLEKSEPRPV